MDKAERKHNREIRRAEWDVKYPWRYDVYGIVTGLILSILSILNL